MASLTGWVAQSMKNVRQVCVIFLQTGSISVILRKCLPQPATSHLSPPDVVALMFVCRRLRLDHHISNTILGLGPPVTVVSYVGAHSRFTEPECS